MTEEKIPEISEPALKTPSKVDKNKDYEMGASIDDANIFGKTKEPDNMDLDYRKDLDKVKNRITGSKLFQDVKGKFVAETGESPQDEIQEEFIRNVNEYEEYEPIINETHVAIPDAYSIWLKIHQNLNWQNLKLVKLKINLKERISKLP